MQLTLEDILNLPFVSWEDKGQLPEEPGLYFMVANNQILYVGKAGNIRRRWFDHDRSVEAKVLLLAGIEVRLHYLAIAPLPGTGSQELVDIERELLYQFDPPFDRAPVLTYRSSDSNGQPLNDLIQEFYQSDEGIEILSEMVEESILFLERGFTPEQIMKAYWLNPKKNFLARCIHIFLEKFMRSLWNSTVPFALKRMRQEQINPADYAAFMRIKRRKHN